MLSFDSFNTKFLIIALIYIQYNIGFIIRRYLKMDLDERRRYVAMMITDLDGTLLSSDRCISRKNIEMLKELEKMDIMRVAATGRNLFSTRKVLNGGFPLDFLIFSSGAGIIRWNPFKILKSHSLNPDDVVEISRFFIELELDFMIHDEIPDNHIFYYFSTGRENPDFWNRINIYGEYANPISKDDINRFSKKATEVVAIGVSLDEYKLIQKELSYYSVIRATSPLDLKTNWVEVFPDGVTKGQGAEYLRKLYSIPIEKVMAVGNDYNDLALLDWAYRSFVVGNAPLELREKYTVVETNENDGFSSAVRKWLETLY